MLILIYKIIYTKLSNYERTLFKKELFEIDRIIKKKLEFKNYKITFFALVEVRQ